MDTQSREKMAVRKSNIELLRVISMLLIIAFHYSFKGGFSFKTFTTNELLIKTAYMFGELGVNLFLLITGYFLINGRFKFQRLICLIAEVLCYHFFTLMIAAKVGIYSFPTDIRGWILECIPIIRGYYWFVTAYVLIYVLSPYLNRFAKGLSKREYVKFLSIVLLLWSVMPTVFGFFYNTTESLLYYNRFIWLVIVYFIGAYIRIHSFSLIQKRGIAAGISFLLLIGSILVIEKLETVFAAIGTYETAYFWTPNSVLMVLLSITIFLFFLNLEIPYSPLINKLGSTTLGIYLFHDGVLAPYLWKIKFQNAVYQDSKFLIVHMLFATLLVFMIGAVIDLIRQYFIERNIIKIWNKAGFCKQRDKISKKWKKYLDLLVEKL